MEENLKEAETQVQSSEGSHNAEQPAQNKNVLFGSISYADDSAYESFLGKMTLNQAVFILIASANFAQAKGSFNILESETLATAIRTIRKNSLPAEAKNEDNA
jgi:hypothetical protein